MCPLNLNDVSSLPEQMQILLKRNGKGNGFKEDKKPRPERVTETRV